MKCSNVGAISPTDGRHWLVWRGKDVGWGKDTTGLEIVEASLLEGNSADGGETRPSLHVPT